MAERFEIVEKALLAMLEDRKYATLRDILVTMNPSDIAGLFENVISVEKKHQRVFSELYEQMKGGTLYKKKEPVLWRCPSCGFEGTMKEAWQKCPLCQAEQGVIKPILPEDVRL